MHLPMVQNEQPPCFGQLWNPRAVECVGGLDPNYKSPTGTHIREKCDFYQGCGTRHSATQIQPYQPTQTPTRPQYPQQVPQYQQQHQMTALAQAAKATLAQLAQGQQQQAQMYPYWPGPGQLQQQPMYMPVPHQQMVPMSAQMPAYLTVPEIRGEDETIWAVLGRELVRSMLKSAGHTAANFFDRTPLRTPAS